MKLAFIVIIIFIISALWCCLKVGSNCDEAMGYDDIIEEGTYNEKV